MNGGLMKTTSRLAIAAAASVIATSAMAADLGGNCCADLEERIADLEATTVRKGNRKVSLTLSGHVHQSILFWDDGYERNTYYGSNNIDVSTRFRLVGQAKIDAEWSAGYLIEMEPLGKSNTSANNQRDQNNDRTDVNTRHSAWWIDNKRLGRVWVGLTSAATDGVEAITLANTNFIANQKVGLLMGGFFLRGTDGSFIQRTATADATWSNILAGNNGKMSLGSETRHNVVKYESPTIAGFILGATVGEDDYWDAALKYANEFNGIRVAGGIGYAQVSDANENNTAGSNHWDGCADNFGTNKDRDCSSLALSGSIMHVPTGLFVSAGYERRKDDGRAVLFGGTAGFSDEDTHWHVNVGVERNFIGIGKTTFYGEYINMDSTPLTDGRTTGFNGGTVVNADVDVWGIGMVQTIDAAAMDLYIGFRNHSADVTVNTSGRLSSPAVEDFQQINAGGVIRF